MYRWYCGLVTVGVLLCDLDLLAEKNQLPNIFSKLKPLAMHGWIYYVLMLFSLYLGGAPRVSEAAVIGENDPGWYFLSLLVPGAVSNAKWFFQFWAATFAMISIPRIPRVKDFLELSFCRYLGKLSFASKFIANNLALKHSHYLRRQCVTYAGYMLTFGQCT